MQVQWSYNGLTEEDQRQLADAWREKQPLVEAKLEEVEASERELRIAVFANRQGDDVGEVDPSGSDRWQALAALQLPGTAVVAESIETVIDQVAQQLAEQIDRYEDQPRSEAPRRTTAGAIVTLLERSRAAGQQQAFSHFLAPVLESFQRYVERELALRQRRGDVPPGFLQPAEVLNETLLRSWDELDSRPPGPALDVWLIGMIHSIIDELGATAAQESAQRREGEPQKEELEAARDEEVQQPSYYESLELADILPGEPQLDQWDQMELDERRVWLGSMLADLTPAQRHALILQAGEGFTIGEVADIQNRSPADVEHDLEEARDRLLWWLRESQNTAGDIGRR